MYVAALQLACLGLVPTPQAPLPNLDFQAGTQVHWQGDGFALRPGAQQPRLVTSDKAPAGKAMLRYVFTVPQGAGRIYFRAHAALGPDCQADKRMNVYLLGAGHRQVPKLRHTANGWVTGNALLSAANGAGHLYCWDVSDEAGETLQIVLLDQDDRPGCHVVCSGFRLERADAEQQRQFAQDMQELQQRNNKMAPLAKFESRNFTAWSNASPDFTAMRLRNCEVLYHAFFRHFEGKGFRLRPPAARLMVAVFDAQQGFEAYMGQKMPNTLTGIYHPVSNRLVVYDLNHNQGVQANRDKALLAGNKLLDFDRVNYIQAVERWARDACTDANIATTMHEAAHQVSYNCGLLNRQADRPMWLAEGLACYCESTENGVWKGIGQPNPERLRTLAGVLKGKGKWVPLAELVGETDWRTSSETLLPGYAQSWALFHMLMHQRPKALREYLATVNARQTADHRLTDFRQAFGADLGRLDREFAAYVQQLVQKYGK
jgi:hypothetical protein